MIRKKGGGRLSLHQKERIAAIQTKRADKLAARCKIDFPITNEAFLGKEEQGVVIAHFGLNVAVEGSSGECFRCAVRKSLADEPVCGDRVSWTRTGNHQGVIIGIQTRSSVLQRPVSYQRLQVIAANVGRIFIVIAATDPNFGLLDRYLVAAGVAGIEAIIIVNKVDLVADLEQLIKKFIHYEQMGYQLLFTSATARIGVTELRRTLAGYISVFVGQSGTGKSSLVAQWISAHSLRIGAINPYSGKGRHTTTVTSLYRLPNGGSIIDSPGIRAFGLHAVSAEGIGHYFVDIVPYFGQCRFSDCQHVHEPHCAVQSAVQSGHIHPARLESLHQIRSSLQQEKLF